jgi:hypothetical protein
MDSSTRAANTPVAERRVVRSTPRRFDAIVPPWRKRSRDHVDEVGTRRHHDLAVVLERTLDGRM